MIQHAAIAKVDKHCRVAVSQHIDVARVAPPEQIETGSRFELFESWRFRANAGNKKHREEKRPSAYTEPLAHRRCSFD